MKYILLICTLTFYSEFVVAQELTVLPKDEAGKYIYYEVVNVTIAKDSVKMRLQHFLSKNRKEIMLKSAVDSKMVVASGKMVIQKTLMLLSHPSGEINYLFNFEMGEKKYRFWLSSFEFFPYDRDRYGNFVPNTKLGVPLEKEPQKSVAQQWEDYRLQTAKYALNFAGQLKNFLANKAILPISSSKEKVISKTW